MLNQFSKEASSASNPQSTLSQTTVIELKRVLFNKFQENLEIIKAYLTQPFQHEMPGLQTWLTFLEEAKGKLAEMRDHLSLEDIPKNKALRDLKNNLHNSKKITDDLKKRIIQIQADMDNNKVDFIFIHGTQVLKEVQQKLNVYVLQPIIKKVNAEKEGSADTLLLFNYIDMQFDKICGLNIELLGHLSSTSSLINTQNEDTSQNIMKKIQNMVYTWVFPTSTLVKIVSKRIEEMMIDTRRFGENLRYLNTINLPKVLQNIESEATSVDPMKEKIDEHIQKLKALLSTTNTPDMLLLTTCESVLYLSDHTQSQIPNVNPDNIKLHLTQQLIDCCTRTNVFYNSQKPEQNQKIFNTLKMWYTTEKNTALAEMVFKDLKSFFEEYASSLNKHDSGKIKKSKLAVEILIHKVGFVWTLEPLIESYIETNGNAIESHLKICLYFTAMTLITKHIDEFIQIHDDISEKTSNHTLSEANSLSTSLPSSSSSFSSAVKPTLISLHQPDHDIHSVTFYHSKFVSLNQTASSGKQKKALGSGFYTNNENIYYLKHVTNRTHVADDLAEILFYKLSHYFKLSHLISECTLVKSDQNQVFVASRVAPEFTPLVDTSKRISAKLLAAEKIKLNFSLSPTEKVQLTHILFLSLLLGDYDANGGNIGRTKNGALIKIDHGWAFEDIATQDPMTLLEELDPYRHFDRIAPFNCFMDYSEIMNSKDFKTLIDDHFKKTNKTQIKNSIKESLNHIISIYVNSPAPAGIDETIFLKEEGSHLAGNGLYSKTEILLKLAQRIGLSDLSALTVESISEKLAYAIYTRLGRLKIINDSNRLFNAALKEKRELETSNDAHHYGLNSLPKMKQVIANGSKQVLNKSIKDHAPDPFKTDPTTLRVVQLGLRAISDKNLHSYAHEINEIYSSISNNEEKLQDTQTGTANLFSK